MQKPPFRANSTVDDALEELEEHYGQVNALPIVRDFVARARRLAEIVAEAERRNDASLLPSPEAMLADFPELAPDCLYRAASGPHNAKGGRYG